MLGKVLQVPGPCLLPPPMAWCTLMLFIVNKNCPKPCVSLNTEHCFASNQLLRVLLGPSSVGKGFG